MTHTEEVAAEHPEAAKAVADRVGGPMAEYIERCLENVEP